MTPPNRYERLATLRAAAWDAIASRRKYEWLASLSFWGFQAAATHEISQRSAMIPDGAAFFIWLMAVALIVAHASWLDGQFDAYTLDKREEEALRAAMRKAAGYSEPPEVTDLRAEVSKKRAAGFAKNWTHSSQLAITIILSFAIIIATAEKVNWNAH